MGSFCFCSLQEVWVFTSHPHKTRWLPRKLPLHLAFSNKEFHFSQADVRQLLAMPGSQRHSKSRHCLSRSLSVCPLSWDLGIDASLSAGRPCECLPCSPVLQLVCVWSHQNSVPSVTVTDGVGPRKGRYKVCPHFPSVDWTTFLPCSHPPPLLFSARS